MNFKYKSIVIFLLAVFLIPACTFEVYKSNLKIKKGMPIEKAQEIIDDDTFINDYIQEEPFNLTESGIISDGTIKVLIRKRFQAVGKEAYIYAFKNDKLIYWGYPIEFTRSSDPLLFNIGKKISEIIQKEEQG